MSDKRVSETAFETVIEALAIHRRVASREQLSFNHRLKGGF
jgi:hypothetical protein